MGATMFSLVGKYLHAILVFEAHITRKNIKEVARTCPIDSRVSSVGLGGDGETSGA